MTASTVLVTGAAGGLGRLVVLMLVERGFRVHAFDSRPEPLWPKGVEFHAGDIRKRGLEQALKVNKPDAVIHLARVRGFELTASMRHRVNYEGTARVVEASLSAGVKKLVFASRHTVYGALADQAQFLTESHPPAAGRTFPEIQDLVAADLFACSTMWRYPDAEVAVLRPVNIVGPTARTTLARYLARSRVPSVAGYDPIYQVIHEEDVARALVQSLEPGVRGVYNVVGPGEAPLHAVIDASGARRVPLPEPLFKLLSGRLGFPPLPQGAIDFLKFACTVDGSRFVEATGFKPRRGLSETLASVSRARD